MTSNLDTSSNLSVLFSSVRSQEDHMAKREGDTCHEPASAEQKPLHHFLCKSEEREDIVYEYS